MKDLASDIVGKIKTGHIIPESKFKLQWKSYAFWCVMSCMIFMGALSLSLIIFNVADIDPRFFRSFELQKIIRITFITAPYLWIALSLLALTFGVLSFQQTTRGYRHSTLFVTSLVVLIISIFGFIGHLFRFDSRMGGFISHNTPSHMRDVMHPREGRWLRPGDGLIGGEITSLGTQEFTLQSFDDISWKIVYDTDLDADDTDTLKVGEKVGVMGEKTGDATLHARSVRKFPDDWEGNVMHNREDMPLKDVK
jgi:hypothetical protein